MRILLQANAPWQGTGYGGPARKLARYLREDGHEVAMLANDIRTGAAVNMDDMVIYPMYHDPFAADVVEAHCDHWRAKLLITLHDIWPYPTNYREVVGFKDGRLWLGWFPLDHEPPSVDLLRVARTLDIACVFSRFGWEKLREAGLPCRYLPLAYDPAVFRPGDKAKAREALGLPREAFICAIVAANMEYPSRKAFPEQLAAFKVFRDRHKEAFLYLHTNLDPEPTFIVKAIDFSRLIPLLGLPEGSWVAVNQYHRLLGLSEQRMALVYQASDVLLSASMAEGFGLPIVEAQACGTPVITNRSTSMPELTHNGLCVEPVQRWFAPQGWWQLPSVEGIAEALERIYSGPEGFRRDEGLKAVAEYAWPHVYRTYWRPLLAELEGGHVH